MHMEKRSDHLSHLVCASTESLMKEARWDGALGHSRHALLQELSSMKSSPVRQSSTKMHVQNQYRHP